MTVGSSDFGITLDGPINDKSTFVFSARGITFHFVNENYDEGKIISQHKISIHESETLISLKTKISRLELLNYPRIISSFIDE